jgi:hypothetical protein
MDPQRSDGGRLSKKSRGCLSPRVGLTNGQDRRSNRVAGDRWPRRVCFGHDVRHPDASVSRPPVVRDDASYGEGRAGQRIRCLGRDATRFLRTHYATIRTECPSS